MSRFEKSRFTTELTQTRGCLTALAAPVLLVAVGLMLVWIQDSYGNYRPLPLRAMAILTLPLAVAIWLVYLDWSRAQSSLSR